MRFCMITTFFGPQSFGGDAVFVDRLTRALARRGHAVDVVHCADSFDAVRGEDPLRLYEAPPGVRIHTLKSRLGILSPLWTHQTGAPGPKAKPIRRILARGRFDVVHFHNVSLIGGPRLLSADRPVGRQVRLMTAHEYWLVCPMHVLWKLDRRPCERPQCIRCSIQGGRPPQLWRYTPLLERSLSGLDALICPSRFSLETHRRLASDVRLEHLPYFLTDDWAAGGSGAAAPTAPRPYFAVAGRLIKLKGFQRLIPLMRQLPDYDLRIAGVGSYEGELRALAAGLPNVRFEGLLGADRVAELFRGAIALVVPSLSWESFGYVILEAFAVGTPAIVRRRGALPEPVDESGGGIVCETDEELLDAMRRIAADRSERDLLGAAGRAAIAARWSEAAHVDRYLELVDRRGGRRAA
jgi:glycosyltransferase involved in cell wall biosynthesis